MMNLISNWRRQRLAISQLSRLSDRELADIGIHRRDIGIVARFAAETSRPSASVQRFSFGPADLTVSREVAPANNDLQPLSNAA